MSGLPGLSENVETKGRSNKERLSYLTRERPPSSQASKVLSAEELCRYVPVRMYLLLPTSVRAYYHRRKSLVGLAPSTKPLGRSLASRANCGLVMNNISFAHHLQEAILFVCNNTAVFPYRELP